MVDSLLQPVTVKDTFFFVSPYKALGLEGLERLQFLHFTIVFNEIMKKLISAEVKRRRFQVL